MLEDASIKLSSVASSLTTVSARAMLAAMIAGESDPGVLAELAKGRMRRKIPELRRALTELFDADHARLAGSILHRLKLVEDALVELDGVLAAAFEPWTHQLGADADRPGCRAKGGRVGRSTTCSAATSPTTTSARTGWPAANDHAHTRRLNAQLGHTVTIDSAA